MTRPDATPGRLPSAFTRERAPASQPAPQAGILCEVGIPECDDYLLKYTTCLVDKVPRASRDVIERALATTCDAWRQAAQTAAGSQSLAQACKAASAAASKAMAAFGCRW